MQTEDRVLSIASWECRERLQGCVRTGLGLCVPSDAAWPLSAGYWQSDKSRFTTCIAHASGGPDNYDPLFTFYNDTWSKSFDYEAAQAAAAEAESAAKEAQ